MKKPVGKTKEELALEKKRELEKRLQDVSGQLNSTKKPPKKGECIEDGDGLPASSSASLLPLPPPHFLFHHRTWLNLAAVLPCSQRKTGIGSASGRISPQRLQFQFGFQ